MGGYIIEKIKTGLTSIINMFIVFDSNQWGHSCSWTQCDLDEIPLKWQAN